VAGNGFDHAIHRFSNVPLLNDEKVAYLPKQFS
jgi:hypothetical protein